MKLSRIAIPLLLLCFVIPALAAPDAESSFANLKSLAGDWTGKTTDGRAVEVSFRVTSNGSALMSEIKGKEDMITMFHLDGSRLLLTHYCGSGNQPRMVGTASPDGKTITFDFLDATNLASPDAAHMHRLVITMPDANHHTEAWTYVDHGKEMTEMFTLARAN
ncbi:MAG TPA: hypothetical protein VLV49_02115 [Terriglobales bacterium]|nr:hypothetical protein [Terriglobales bacterium]